MSHYISSIFMALFFVAMALALGLSGGLVENSGIGEEFGERVSEDFGQAGSNYYNTLLNRIVSFETIAGLVAGAGVGLLFSSSGIFVVSLAVLGGFIGYMLNYYAIIHLISSTLPTPLVWILYGTFGIMFMIMFMRFSSGR